MNSNRKRGRKGHSEEKLIEGGLHPNEVPNKQEESIVVADRVQSRNDMIIATENEEVSIFAIRWLFLVSR